LTKIFEVVFQFLKIRSSSILKVYGRLPFTKGMEVVFHFILPLSKHGGRLPFTKKGGRLAIRALYSMHCIICFVLRVCLRKGGK
jgi:hypothetical protein